MFRVNHWAHSARVHLEKELILLRNAINFFPLDKSSLDFQVGYTLVPFFGIFFSAFSSTETFVARQLKT